MEKSNKHLIIVMKFWYHYLKFLFSVLSMLPNLRENVERILNAEPFTALLKSK